MFLDLDVLDDDDVDEHMHDYAFVENSDDENFIDDSYVQVAADASVEDVFDGALNHAAFMNQEQARELEHVEQQYYNVMECLRRPHLLRNQYERHLALDEFEKGKIRGTRVSKGKGGKKRSRESISTSSSTSDEESLTCRRTRTAEESLLNSDESYSSDCSEEASDVSENTENTRNVREMSQDIDAEDAGEQSEDEECDEGTCNAESGTGLFGDARGVVERRMFRDNSYTDKVTKKKETHILFSCHMNKDLPCCAKGTRMLHGDDVLTPELTHTPFEIHDSANSHLLLFLK